MTKPYGCHNRTIQSGYWAPARVWNKLLRGFETGSKFILNRMSRECHYDQRTTDQRCAGCKHIEESCEFLRDLFPGASTHSTAPLNLSESSGSLCPMDPAQQEEARAVLSATRKYLQQAHDDAESKHDSRGEHYMSYVQYEIMEETVQLLARIDALIR